MGVHRYLWVEDGGTTLFRGSTWGYTPIWEFRMGVGLLFRGSGWGYNPVWGYRMGVHPYLWYRMGVDPCFGVLDGVHPLFEDPPLFGDAGNGKIPR